MIYVLAYFLDIYLYVYLFCLVDNVKEGKIYLSEKIGYIVYICDRECNHYNILLVSFFFYHFFKRCVLIMKKNIDICVYKYNCLHSSNDYDGIDDNNMVCQTTLREVFICQEEATIKMFYQDLNVLWDQNVLSRCRCSLWDQDVKPNSIMTIHNIKRCSAKSFDDLLSNNHWLWCSLES